ncbi:Short-chain dehydrogenase TIC 32 like [Actinidia chinensis var. chinensis]|uniref:Short-chain dehydrogenase TIC 32 like n=1 Tax=Actinidia chinensis var. chinensis TaxID=1590841 RepID=A0A2R6Q905_ACTCC|nr:Short-chain dehydrogenase TIC 32 like [Actinidia chinensis var. chinensis]
MDPILGLGLDPNLRILNNLYREHQVVLALKLPMFMHCTGLVLGQPKCRGGLRGVHVIMGVRNMAAGKEVKEAIVKEIPVAKIDASRFLLTNLLLDTMKKTSLKTKKEGRIVNVSSEAHRFPYRERIRFDKVNDQVGYRSLAAYGQSKIASVLHANELARRLKEYGAEITANSPHPGAITTNLFRHHSYVDGLVNMLGRYVLKNVQQGAATTCYVALHPQAKGGGLFVFETLRVDMSGSHLTTSSLMKSWVVRRGGSTLTYVCCVTPYLGPDLNELPLVDGKIDLPNWLI